MTPVAFAPLTAHLWQSTLFAAMAGLMTIALRRNQAHVRYWLWLAASYKFLLPFSWLVTIGHQFEWRAAPPNVPPAFSVVTDAITGPIFLTMFPSADRGTAHTSAFPMVMFAVWACGLIAVVASWVREWLRVRAIVRTASPLALDLPIRVVSTPKPLEPGVFGIVRPALLLPEGITTRLTQAQLQAILAHELCHVRRRDNLTAAIHMLVEAIFWFHPMVWWLGARLMNERERACDEEVLQGGSQAHIYAESILKVCEFYLESPLACVSGVSGSGLKKRIKRIMKEHFGVALSARKKFLLGTAAVAVLAVPLIAGVLAVPLRAQSAPGQSPKVEVGTITFQGNEVFSNQKLVRAMRNSRPYAIPLYLFTIPISSKTFNRAELDSKLKEDLERGVRALYQNDGYFKVLVGDPILQTVDGGKATNIAIPIKEGAQYHMGHLLIRTASSDNPPATSTEALQAAFSLKTGDIFDVAKVRRALAIYTKLSGRSIVPLVKVNTISNTIDVTVDFETSNQASRDTAGN